MDALEAARHKSYKRLLRAGLSEQEAAIKAGLVEPPEVVHAEVVHTVEPVVDYEVKPEKKEPETKRGKVIIEVCIHLDTPIVLRYSADMRGALLKTQQNRKFLGDKFSGFLKSFLGRVDDVS